MLFHMGLGGMLRMIIRLDSVGSRGVGVVGRLFVIARLVMFGGFGVMLRCVGMMFSSLLVMIDSFFRHRLIPLYDWCQPNQLGLPS